MVLATAIGLMSAPSAEAAVTGGITGPAGMCVDVSGGSSANGTAVQLWWCNGTAAQQWTAQADGTVHALGKCLDVSGGATASGTQVQLWDCNGTGAQMWARSNLGLINPQSGLCLDATGGNTAAGTPLQIWWCNGTAAQQWILPAGSDVVLYDETSGTYTFTLHSVDNAQSVIRCQIEASTPAARRLGGVLHVTSIGSTVCDAPVLSITMTHSLFLYGLSVGFDYQLRLGGNNVATEPDVVCISGQYRTFASAAIVPPPGYFPIVGVIFTTNDHSVYISVSTCLGNVIGMSDQSARAYVAQLGLTVGAVTTQTDSAPVGTVISHSLQANGTVVDLVESSGNAIVPNVMGLSEAFARDLIESESVGLVVGEVTYIDDCISPGDVEVQHPFGGVHTTRGTPVDLTISTCEDGNPK